MDKQEKIYKLSGTLCTFGFGDKKRRWITVNRTFGEVKRFCVIEEYSNDKGTGEQRGRIQSWCNNLGRQMINDNFTPASWAAGIRESHLQYLTIEGNRATLLIPEDNPIPCLDGNQRWGGVEHVYAGADPALRRIIDSQTITLQIYLDPEEIKADFKRLQMGRPVDKNHLKSMEWSDDSKLTPVEKMMKEVARRLDVNPESPLLNQIKFDSSERKPMGFDPLTTKQASELSTSLKAGANIALHESYNRDSLWVTKMYIAAYQAIYKYGSKEEIDLGEGVREFPRLLMKRRVLRGTLLGGGKGSSSLLIGIGNALIFRMAHLGRDEPTVKDLKHFVECLEDVFMEDVDGNMSGGTKRKYMGAFGRRYFRDIVNQDGQVTDETKMSGRNGIPAILCELTSDSSWGITRDWKQRQLLVNSPSEDGEPEDVPHEDVDTRQIPSDTTDDFFDSENEEVAIEPEDEPVIQEDEEEEEEEKPKSRSKRKRKAKPAMG